MADDRCMGSVTRKKAATSKSGKAKTAGKTTAKKTAAKKTAKKTAAKSTAKKTAKKKGLSRTPPDLEVDPDVLELIAAIDKYKKSHNRPFPSWSEVLYVLRKLGYTKG